MCFVAVVVVVVVVVVIIIIIIMIIIIVLGPSFRGVIFLRIVFFDSI